MLPEPPECLDGKATLRKSRRSSLRCGKGSEIGLQTSLSRLVSRVKSCCSSAQIAGILFARWLDQLERLVRAGDGHDDIEDIPLVFHLPAVLDANDVHLLKKLVIPRAEDAF